MTCDQLEAWEEEAHVIRAARDEVLRRRERARALAAARAPLEARIAELRAGPKSYTSRIDIVELEYQLRRIG